MTTADGGPTERPYGRHVDAKERRREIVALARSQGAVTVNDLALALQVSLETVRRDLTALEAAGLIRRSYGRAYAVETAAYESNLPYRETAQFDEKQRIAIEAVRHLESAETIFI